jgi:hypothetical protein
MAVRAVGVGTSSFLAELREVDLREDAPPARQRALKARGGREAAGLDTSVFRWLVAHRVRALV